MAGSQDLDLISTTPEQQKNESIAWLSMIAIMIGFPVLFFLCAYLPIWLGWTNTFE
jgi:hypothetical protein